MKLSSAVEPVVFRLKHVLQLAFLPTLGAIFRKPTLLIRPRQVSAIFFSHVWAVYGDEIDAGLRDVKTMLITPNARNGHTAHYLDRQKVTRYVAIEPNELMHASIRRHANAAGFYESDSTLLILACGAEDIPSILRAMARVDPPASGPQPDSAYQPEQPANTIVSFLSLCTVPRPEHTIAGLVRDVLKSGGNFITHEHVLSHRQDVAWWQGFWAPIWALVFDGCRMDRPIDVWVRELVLDNGIYEERKATGDESPESAWVETKLWQDEGEMEERLIWHSGGVFTKR
ncbi:hypothetical protein NLJ89_g8772 [Agrocybe chaxingu]|uniref:Uncharacterized protein n=1 Tax=Agrocybe chaxingu TaxID=84603 RepID=A0A9W8JUT1_9AGAR|nr:hypothetical protein NLJ89_g8772 [Agrocybe chaxingu]